MVHVHSLTFRITSRQLRNLLIGALFITAAAVGSGIAAADRAGPGGRTMASAVGLGIAALLYFYAVAAYAVARTECKPTGIRTRGLGGPRSCGWADMRDISVRRGRSRIVVVTTAAGRRFWLGAPVDGGIMPDPDLAAKLAQICGYWHSAGDRHARGRHCPRLVVVTETVSRHAGMPALPSTSVLSLIQRLAADEREDRRTP